MTRRNLFKGGAAAAAASLNLPMFAKSRSLVQPRPRLRYSTRAIDLVKESLVVDMLGLLTLDWQKLDRWQEDGRQLSGSEFAALRESGVTVCHPAVDLSSDDPYQATSDWLARWNAFLQRNQTQFTRVNSASDLATAKAEGKIGILLGLQNSDHLRGVSDLAYFHGLGQRISQLTYNNRNRVGYGCMERHDAGLTEYGASLVTEMNRIGMAVDVSHAGEQTTIDACLASRLPVLITHANCRALVSHPRCKSDLAIRAMAATGGVMGITTIRLFVHPSGAGSISHVLDHFDHVARLVGVEHVGIGTDAGLDSRGPSRTMREIAGIEERIYDVTEGLIRRGYTNRHIQLVLGGNFRRTLSDIFRS